MWTFILARLFKGELGVWPNEESLNDLPNKLTKQDWRTPSSDRWRNYWTNQEESGPKQFLCHQRWGVSWHKPSNILCCITKFTPVSFDTIDNRIVILKWVLFKKHLEMYYIEISLHSVCQITICWIKMCSVQHVSRMYYIERSLQSICQKTGQKSTRQSKFKFPRYLLIIIWRNK